MNYTIRTHTGSLNVDSMVAIAEWSKYHNMEFKHVSLDKPLESGEFCAYREDCDELAPTELKELRKMRYRSPFLKNKH